MAADHSQVFIVDDDASVRRALTRIVRARGYAAEAYASAEAFLDEHPEGAPGCLVVDLRMPGMDGLELQEGLNQAASSMPVVFLTGHGDVATSVRAMKSGATNFLTKPVDEADLVQAVEEALARWRRSLEREESHGSFRTRVNELSRRQREVMHLVIAGRMNKQIAEELGIAEKTVKVHRGKMMELLDVGSVAELVRLSVESGVSETSGAAREAQA